MVTTSKNGRRNCRSACQPCRKRKRKRKCDGADPCQSCVRYDYRCYYPDPGSSDPQRQDGTVLDAQSGVQNVPLSYASESQRLIPITLNEQQRRAQVWPTSAQRAGASQDQDLKADSWNLGLRVDNEKTIVDLISYSDACGFANVFFRNVNPVFNLIDQGEFATSLETRWLEPSVKGDDSVIAGVIALGSLFSGADAHAREDEICNIARHDLESRRKPNEHTLVHHVTKGWILRLLFLRMAHNPQSAWIASCSCIAVIEEDSANARLAAAATPIVCNGATSLSNGDSGGDMLREHARLHWVARMLHTWVYQDCAVRAGARPVRNLPCANPKADGREDIASALISLYILSDEWCCPQGAQTLSGLTDSLQKVRSLTVLENHPVTQLFKSNHAFCLYRFMRLTGVLIPPSTLSLVIELTRPGLDAAAWLAEDQQPWWHVAHLPFQFLCVMLCMDTKESLQEVEHAMTILRRVERCFKTKRMQSVIKTAEALVAMCRASKIEAVSALSRGTEDTTKPSFMGLSEPVTDLATPNPAPITSIHSAMAGTEMSALWGSDLVMSDFSWDEFLETEFPLNPA